jgi:hypothetical protein
MRERYADVIEREAQRAARRGALAEAAAADASGARVASSGAEHEPPARGPTRA